MKIFNNYSKYYDLLYTDKNYQGEAEYIHQLIQQNSLNAKSMLNLGCGTGKHDFEFAKLGYKVVGIDLSQGMVDIANINNIDSVKLQFYQGDVRNVRLNKKFDVVVSLFHVMSYQITNEDLMAAFDTAREHLKEGGIFIFDYWYGPGVLTDPPLTRVKRIEDKHIEVLRIAEPFIQFDKNIVDVCYEIRVKDKFSGIEEIIKEKHTVRYLFLQEIATFSKNLIKINDYAWLTFNHPKSEWFTVSVFKS
jgi:SAM-dependent methyltransferase